MKILRTRQFGNDAKAHIVDYGWGHVPRYQMQLVRGIFTFQFPTTEPVGLEKLYRMLDGAKAARDLERRIKRYKK